MSGNAYNKHLSAARRIIGNIEKSELQALLRKLYANPPAESSLRDDPVVSQTLMAALQIWWARQVKLSLDASQTKSPTPTVTQVLASGYEEDAVLKDWGGLLHRAKAEIGNNNLVHFTMWDFHANRWTVSRTFQAMKEESRTSVRIRVVKQSWVPTKPPAHRWSADGGMRLVPYLRGKPL